MALTAKAIDAAKPQASPYKLTDGLGLYLLVMPSGGRLWRMNYRFEGRQKTLAFGSYPDVSLAKARERSEEHTSELQSLMRISYAVFCLKTKKARQISTSSTSAQPTRKT